VFSDAQKGVEVVQFMVTPDDCISNSQALRNLIFYRLIYNKAQSLAPWKARLLAKKQQQAY